jgi:hypothetical protein
LFDYPSQLKRIESQAFHETDLVVVIPSTVLFVAFDAFSNLFQISIADCNSCPEFDRWHQLRQCNIAVDFRRILRNDSGFVSFNDCLIDFSIFEEGPMLVEFDGIWNEMYQRCDDGSSVIVKSISGLESKESLLIEIENLLNLSHPCILGPIGFILEGDWSVSRLLKIVEFYWEGNSLSEVNSKNPV